MMRFEVLSRLIIGILTIIVSVWINSAPSDEVSPTIHVESIKQVGVVPIPPEHAGRDVGFSGKFHDLSVWVFGDTFLPRAANDGLRWRSGSWSWTTDNTSENGIGPFKHALDNEGLAKQLLPHTSSESSYNITHQCQEDNPANKDCGSRRTPWPQALIVDPSGDDGLLFYLNMETGPKGQWDFRSVSGSVATWSDPGGPANRVEPPLFSNSEPDWGSAAVLAGENIYVYACEFDGTEKPCLVARVPFHAATDRTSYRFWAGNGEWSKEWRNAIPVFNGASLFSVHYNAYLGKYLAFYMAGTASEITYRTADLPQGPWSESHAIGYGLQAYENWSYALIAHPEFSRENGRVEVLSYTRPTAFLRQEIRLIELRFD